jgi:hypothetical protein
MSGGEYKRNILSDLFLHKIELRKSDTAAKCSSISIKGKGYKSCEVIEDVAAGKLGGCLL